MFTAVFCMSCQLLGRQALLTSIPTSIQLEISRTTRTSRPIQRRTSSIDRAIFGIAVDRPRRLRSSWTASRGIWYGCHWTFCAMHPWRRMHYLLIRLRRACIHDGDCLVMLRDALYSVVREGDEFTNVMRFLHCQNTEHVNSIIEWWAIVLAGVTVRSVHLGYGLWRGHLVFGVLYSSIYVGVPLISFPDAWQSRV